MMAKIIFYFPSIYYPNILLCLATSLNSRTLSDGHNRLEQPSLSVVQRLFTGYLAHDGPLASSTCLPGCPHCKAAHLAQLPFVCGWIRSLVVHLDACEFHPGLWGCRILLVLVDQ